MTQAIILVGGQGTRLRPLTCHTPKAMVPVLNVPFLEHIINNLKEHGITDIILAQGHLSESITTYFGDGSRLGVKLISVVEDSPRGTAGAIKNAEPHLTEPFFVLNGDIFHNRDFTGIMSCHKEHGAKVSIVLTPVEDPTIYGVVETDPDNRVLRFTEKPKKEDVVTNLINAGTYFIEPEILRRIPDGTRYSFERELFPQMLRDGEPVYACRSDNYWMDTGTPEKYLQLHRDCLGNQCDGYQFEHDRMIGTGCRIDASLQTLGRVIIGKNCTIGVGVRLKGPVVMGDNCIIGERSYVEDSVIWQGTHVGAWTDIKHSAIADNCTIGNGVVLADSVLGDHVTIPENTSLAPGTRIFPEGTSPTD